MKYFKIIGSLFVAFLVYFSFFWNLGSVTTDDLIVANKDGSFKKKYLMKSMYDYIIGVKFLAKWEWEYDLDVLFHALENGYIAINEGNKSKLVPMQERIEKKLGFFTSKDNFRTVILEELKSFKDKHLVSSILEKKETLDIGKNIARNSWTIFQHAGNSEVALMGFTTFNLFDESYEIRDKIESAIENSKAILIDLRGNLGGQSIIPLYIAGEIFTEYADSYYSIPGFLQRTDFMNSNTHYALSVNWAFISRITNPLSSEKGTTEFNFEASKIYYRDSADRSRDVAFSERTVKTHDKSLFFKGPILIIQDRTCASACEHFIRAMRKHPRVTTFGTNTSGMANFGGIGSLILPNSSLLFGISNSKFTFNDGFKEFVGIPPMIKARPEENIFNQAFKLIELDMVNK
ncbi:MAG: hypothetical protein ACJAT2_003483 [Bacteriovoracaceae bacterium]|jgi:hypothetical protein